RAAVSTASPARSIACRRGSAISRASMPAPASPPVSAFWASRHNSKGAAPWCCRCASPTATCSSASLPLGRSTRCSEAQSGEVGTGSPPELRDRRLFFLLFRQIRMRTAEIRRRRILPHLEHALADRTGALEMLEQRFAVAVADRARQRRDILVEAAQHLQHRVLIGEEDV